MPIEPVQTSRTGVARRYGLTGARGRNNAVTLGNKASASADGVTSLGDAASTSSTAANATVVGRNATASGTSAVAVGNGSTASGTSAVAVGNGAIGSGNNVVVAGPAANASGSSAIAVGNSAVASNTSSIAIGGSASASGAGAIVLGVNATASGTSAVAVGNGAAASGTNATALGSGANGSRFGQHATANGQFSTAGDAQLSQYVMRRQTTDATPTEVTSDNSTTGYITIAATRTMSATIKIAAHRTDVSGTAAAWPLIQCAITRDATGNCRLLGSASGAGTTTYCDAGATTWSVAVTADTTNNRLAITVTGETAKTIRWVATVDMAEVG